MISVAGASTPNAVGLVYVAAFALDEGRGVQRDLRPVRRHAHPRRGPAERVPGRRREDCTELTIAPELYREAFAADLPEDDIRVLAVRQRPFAAIFEDRAEAAARKSLPSWYVVATGDNAIPAGKRAPHGESMGAKTIEVDASRSIARSQPAAVSELIRTAVDESSAVRAAS